MGRDSFPLLNGEIINCVWCPRLVEYRARISCEKRHAYRGWEYWGRPVPGFGDPNGKLLIVGLAPGAHGANRTGRMFTGDRSGEFLFRALFETGFASQPASVSADDGLTLMGAYVTAAVRCAPPDNKPSREETAECRPFLERELDLLPNTRVTVALGRFAFDVYLSILLAKGEIERRSAFAFGHGNSYRTGLDRRTLIASYHPSQQNTSTGKLTAGMLAEVFRAAKSAIGE